MSKWQGVIYTPDDEPYLGLDQLKQLDKMISLTMELNAKIAPAIRGRSLSDLEKAAVEIIPHGFSIALSIRELIRQGYLLSARILVRPLAERAAVITYLVDNPSSVEAWRDGWKHKDRPPLWKLIASMREGTERLGDHEEIAREIAADFHMLVHADPVGASKNAILTDDGQPGFSPTKDLDSPIRCEDLCLQVTTFLIILSARAAEILGPKTKEEMLCP